jgi:hypothetical protein
MGFSEAVCDMNITVKYNHTRFIGVIRVLIIINKKIKQYENCVLQWKCNVDFG